MQQAYPKETTQQGKITKIASFQNHLSLILHGVRRYKGIGLVWSGLNQTELHARPRLLQYSAQALLRQDAAPTDERHKFLALSFFVLEGT